MIDNNLDRYRICSKCGSGYFYFDSPAMPKCFCGGMDERANKRTDDRYISKCYLSLYSNRFMLKGKGERI